VCGRRHLRKRGMCEPDIAEHRGCCAGLRAVQPLAIRPYARSWMVGRFPCVCPWRQHDFRMTCGGICRCSMSGTAAHPWICTTPAACSLLKYQGFRGCMQGRLAIPELRCWCSAYLQSRGKMAGNMVSLRTVWQHTASRFVDSQPHRGC
jgi:hypothetical protein